jgi:Tfp pilus assembly protein PilO
VSVTGNEEGKATGPDGRSYGIANISFSIATTYEQFKSFLADVERSMRLLDITSISFGQPDALGLTTYSVRAQTYWLR